MRQRGNQASLGTEQAKLCADGVRGIALTLASRALSTQSQHIGVGHTMADTHKRKAADHLGGAEKKTKVSAYPCPIAQNSAHF